jgi:hypothetical protein
MTPLEILRARVATLDALIETELKGLTITEARRHEVMLAMTVPALDLGLIPDLDIDPFDEEEDCDLDCGRWDNGRLTNHCSLAGTEFCDFECFHGSART